MPTPPLVLVVDDEPMVLETLAWGLRRHGFEVVALARFDEAKHFIEESPPDALVTDVRLGAYNGLQLAINFRAVRPGASVVVLSGYDDAVIRQETERLGAVFFTKPVSAEALASLLM